MKGISFPWNRKRRSKKAPSPPTLVMTPSSGTGITPPASEAKRPSILSQKVSFARSWNKARVGSEHTEPNKVEPSLSQTETKINKYEDKAAEPLNSSYLQTASTFQQNNAKPLCEVGVRLAALTSTANFDITSLEEKWKVVLKVLDTVSGAHPYVGAALLAFKAVAALETKRRQNDMKILALMEKMGELFVVLMQLDHPSSVSIPLKVKDQLQNIMDKVTVDIETGSNACDVYHKQHLIVKILKSPIWDDRFADYTTRFMEHRNKIVLALSVRTASQIDAVLEKQRMAELIRTLKNPEERAITAFVLANGGPDAYLSDDAKLKDLLLEYKNLNPDEKRLTDLTRIKTELGQSLQNAMDNNMKQFLGRLEAHKVAIVTDIKTAVKIEGDRVIEAVTSNVHQGVDDTELQKLWQQMGWKSNVKARHFVLTMLDFYAEKHAPKDPRRSISYETDDGNSNADQDQWAYPYIHISRLRPIAEAFDGDNSGFISVREANQFSMSKPDEFSMLHWIAYWAAGWHLNIWDYRRKIAKVIKRLDYLQDHVRTENRDIVDCYLRDSAFLDVQVLMMSVKECNISFGSDLFKMIQPYTEAEEKRLKKALDSFQWDIDDSAAVTLIAGRRIERCLFPLLYLLLERHMRIFEIACIEILKDDELEDAAFSLYYVIEQVAERMSSLAAIWKQHDLDVARQFGNFAWGMFKLMHEPLDVDRSWTKTVDDEEQTHPTEATELDLSLLTHGIKRFYEPRVLNPGSENRTSDETLGFDLNGLWTGHDRSPWFEGVGGVIEIRLVTNDDGSFSGEGTGASGDFDITNGVILSSGDSSDYQIAFKKKFRRPDLQFLEVPFKGVGGPSRLTITGQWGGEEMWSSGDFEFRKAPSFTHQFRYTAEEFSVNPARARWSFACAATRDMARKKLFSWSYIHERAKIRRRFVELSVRRDLEWHGYANETPSFENKHWLSAHEKTELDRLDRGLAPADAAYYRFLALSEYKKLSVHQYVTCDACQKPIPGPSRVVCLECNSPTNQVDLCLGCSHLPTPSTANTSKFKHKITHDMMQIRYPMMPGANTVYMCQLGSKAVQRGKHIYTSTSASDDTDDMACSDCKEPLQLPCWFCVECDTNVFLCASCNKKPEVPRHSSYPPKKKSDSPDSLDPQPQHKFTHPLVCWFPDSSVDTRFFNMERRMTALESALNKIETRMEQLLSQFTSERGIRMAIDSSATA